MKTTTELATDFETTPRTLRKFLRSEGKGVGKGSRYALPSTKREVNAMRKRFIAWGEALEANKSSKTDDSNASATDALDTPDDATIEQDFDSLDHPLD